jgi:hypothetical protein
MKVMVKRLLREYGYPPDMQALYGILFWYPPNISMKI